MPVVLSDWGYADELVVQRLVNLLSGSTRLATALATVDSEFNAKWTSSSITTPAPAQISANEYDMKIGYGQAQVFVAALDSKVKDKHFSQQPVHLVTAYVAVTIHAQNLATVGQYLRRYKCAIARVLSTFANRGINPDNDQLAGVIGIGTPSYTYRLDPINQRGVLECTLPEITVQEYGN